MRVHAFELDEPLPELREPHALATLSLWVDVGQVGSLTLGLLETISNARELGKLRRPGLFYDFTRYRPMLYRIENRREIKVPNTFVKYGRLAGGNDFLFLHCLEPHMLGETYADAIVRLLEKLKVKRFCLLGAMYDAVPHTRPLLISGTASDQKLEARLRELKVFPSSYQGPTTISLLSMEQAVQRGLESLTLIVHLPHYAQLEEDFIGQYTLLSLICSLYNFSLDLSPIRKKGEEQYKRLSVAVEMNTQVKEIVEGMERQYDARSAEEQKPAPMPPLSPELEKFLKEMDKRFDSGS